MRPAAAWNEGAIVECVLLGFACALLVAGVLLLFQY